MIAAQSNFMGHVLGTISPLILPIDLAAGPGSLNLFQNDVVIDPSLDLSQFTIADYSGYASDTVTWSGPYLDESGLWHRVRNASFAHNGGGTANSIYGWYALWNDGDGANVWIAEKWSVPIGMASAADFLTFLAELKLPLPVGASPPNG